MQNILYGETEKHYEKHVFWVFLIMLSIKTLKYMRRTLCLGKKRTLRETRIMSVFLSSLSAKKLKPTNNTLYLEKKIGIIFFSYSSS